MLFLLLLSRFITSIFFESTIFYLTLQTIISLSLSFYTYTNLFYILMFIAMVIINVLRFPFISQPLCNFFVVHSVEDLTYTLSTDRASNPETHRNSCFTVCKINSNIPCIMMTKMATKTGLVNSFLLNKS